MRINKIILFLLFVVMSLTVRSQTANVSLTVVPPYSPRLTDYTDVPGKTILMVTNTSTMSYDFFLRVTLTGDNGIRIYSNPNYNYRTRNIAAGQTIQADVSMLRTLFDENSLVFSGITKEEVLRKNGLPEGNYELCVQAFWSRSVTAPPGPLGQPTCASFRVASVEPPMLIKPYDKEEVRSLQPQSVVFTWSMPAGAQPGLRYKLRVVEVPDRIRNPSDAFVSSTRPPFFETTVSANVYVFGPADPPLVEGRKYAWAVATIPTGNVTGRDEGTFYRNRGRSEIWSFTYGQTQEKQIITVPPIAATKPVRPSEGQKFTPFIKPSELHKNIFKGRVVWSFLKTENTKTYDVMNANYQLSDKPAVQADFKDISSGLSASGLGAVPSTPPTLPFTAANYTNATPKPNVNAQPGMQVYGASAAQTYIDPATKNTATNSLASKIDQFADNQKYPLSHAKVFVELVSYKTEYNQDGESVDEYRSTLAYGKTDEEGNFSIEYNGEQVGHELSKGDKIVVTVSNQYFFAPDVTFVVQPGTDGIYDFGEIRCLARTYRLKINVTDPENNKLANAKIDIFRNPGFYTENENTIAIDREVERMEKPDSVEAKKKLMAGSKSGSSSKAGQQYNYNLGFNFSGESYPGEFTGNGTSGKIFRKVFTPFWQIGSSDFYYVRISGEGIETKTEKLMVSEKIYNIFDPVKMVEVTFKAQLKAPSINGHVVLKTGDVPVKNAKVFVVNSKDPGKMFISPKTSEDGSFSLNGVETSNDPYTLFVKYQGKDYQIESNLLIDKKGIAITRDPIRIDGQTIKICGKVTDPSGNGMANVLLRWKSGGNTFSTNEKGEYSTTIGVGNNTLIATMPGFRQTQKVFDVKESKGDCIYNLQLEKFYVKVKVVESGTGKIIAGAKVRVEENQSFKITDANGFAILDNVNSPSGVVIASGDDNSFYAATKLSIAIDNSLDTTFATIELKAGSKITGVVTANGLGQKGALVGIEGMDYTQVSTEQSGKYTLIIPPGDYSIVAQKTGFMGANKLITATANQSSTLDFALTDPGFKADKLLGFDVMLSSSKDLGGNKFEISGSLVNLKSNTAFEPTKTDLKIPFDKLIVVKDASGKIKPENGKIISSINRVDMKTLKWMNVFIEEKSGIVVSEMPNSSGQGEIRGVIKIDITKTFSSLINYKIPDADLTLNTDNSTTIGAINSTGNFPSANFNLGKGIGKWELYGLNIELDYSKSSVGTDGLNMTGQVKTNQIPGLGELALKIKQLKIGTSGAIVNCDLDLNPNPEIKLAVWKMKFNAGNFNSYGFTLSGNVDLPIPGAENSQIGFKDLSVSLKNGLSGGQFSLPKPGINMFGVAKLNSLLDGTLGFVKVPSINGYKISGNGIQLLFNKYIDKELKLKTFAFQTDGNFEIGVEKDFEVGFMDMALIKIHSFGVTTLNNDYGFDIDGEVKLKIPGLGLGAATHVFYKQKSGFSIDKLAINFDLASTIKANAMVSFANNGFEGKGGISIASVADFDIGFYYRKISGGTELGASITTGVPVIVGAVRLSKLSGQFSCNTATSIYKVGLGCALNMVADPGLVSLDPLQIAVTTGSGGVVLDGYAKAKLLQSWDAGEASFHFDIGKKFFTIDASLGGGFKLIEGVDLDSKSSIHAEVNAGSDEYVFVSFNSNANIAGIFNSQTTIVAGWNAPQNAHATLQALPQYSFYNGRIYGGYFKTGSKVGFGPKSFDAFEIATVNAWYNASGSAEVYGNVKGASYGFKLQQVYDCGANVDFFGIGGASAAIYVSGALEGFYKNGSWGVSADLQGSISAHIGCDGGCNGITWGCCFNTIIFGRRCPCPCGAKLCISGGLHAEYTSENGWDFSVKL